MNLFHRKGRKEHTPEQVINVKVAQRLSTLPSPACGRGAGGEGKTGWTFMLWGVFIKVMPVGETLDAVLHAGDVEDFNFGHSKGDTPNSWFVFIFATAEKPALERRGVVITAAVGPRASLSKSRRCGPRPARDKK